MSSDVQFGFENCFHYETSYSSQTATDQDQLFFEIQNFLINETSSWEEIVPLLVPRELESSPEVQKEESSQLNFSFYKNSFSSAADFMQRNYGQYTESFPFRPHFHPVFDSKNLENPESFCSNGDLQNKEKATICSEKSLLKVGRYSKEERKWRIDRYRAKRSRRNFNKTIKYACRKTLADRRQRIRGRFVRSDDVGEILEASFFHIYM